jgi:hypothetical protein
VTEHCSLPLSRLAVRDAPVNSGARVDGSPPAPGESSLPAGGIGSNPPATVIRVALVQSIGRPTLDGGRPFSDHFSGHGETN